MIKQINEAKRASAAQWSDRMKRRKDTKKRIFENRSESEESNSSYDDESKNENSEFSCDDNRIPKQCANCCRAENKDLDMDIQQLTTHLIHKLAAPLTTLIEFCSINLFTCFSH